MTANRAETITELLSRLATPALKMPARPADGQQNRPWDSLREIAHELGHTLTLSGPEGRGDGPWPVTGSAAVPEPRYPAIVRNVRFTHHLDVIRRARLVDEAELNRLYRELGIERQRQHEEWSDRTTAFLEENHRQSSDFWRLFPWRQLGRIVAAADAGTLAELDLTEAREAVRVYNESARERI